MGQHQCRRHGFDPCFRKISHAAEQLGPCATAARPVLRARAWQPQKQPEWEVCTLTTGGTRLLQPEESLCSSEDPAQPKKIETNVKEELTWEVNFRIFLKICLFILAVQGLSWGTLDLTLCYVESRSLTRDWTWGPSVRRLESLPLDHQGSPQNIFIFLNSSWLTAWN